MIIISKCGRIMAGLLLFCIPNALSGATVSLNFEEGAFGTYWTNLSTGDTSPNFVFVDAAGSNGGEAVISGTYSLGPGPWSERDQSHDLLHIQSAPFVLDGSGDLTFQLYGGSDDSSFAPALGTGAVGANVQGVALTRVSDGERVLSQVASFPGSSPPPISGTPITWTQAALAPYASEAGEAWTIDVYDSFSQSGEWSWFSADDFVIPGSIVPEPTTYVLAVLALGMALLLRR